MENEEKEIIGFEWGPKGDEDLLAELLEAARYLIYGLSFMKEIFELNINEQLGTFHNQSSELAKLAMEEP